MLPFCNKNYPKYVTDTLSLPGDDLVQTSFCPIFLVSEQAVTSTVVCVDLSRGDSVECGSNKYRNVYAQGTPFLSFLTGFWKFAHLHG